MRHGRPIWSVSAWGGFICILLAAALLFHGYVGPTFVMTGGGLVLLGWAAWLAHGGR